MDNVPDATLAKWMQEYLPTEPMLQFFSYDHLPHHLRGTSKVFCGAALVIASDLPRNPERTACLRKLLEAKDCAVRAVIMRDSV